SGPAGPAPLPSRRQARTTRPSVRPAADPGGWRNAGMPRWAPRLRAAWLPATPLHRVHPNVPVRSLLPAPPAAGSRGGRFPARAKCRTPFSLWTPSSGPGSLCGQRIHTAFNAQPDTLHRPDTLHWEENHMQIQPYLFFDGRCEEAIRFYQDKLGAEVTMLMR